MNRTSHHAQSLTRVGAVLTVLGLVAIVVGTFVIGDTMRLGRGPSADAAPLKLAVTVLGGALFNVGILSALLSVVVAGFHSSLVNHSQAAQRAVDEP